MDYSDAGLTMTKSFEGLRLNAYRDVVGVLTIGYGHTGNDVVAGQVITQAQADALLVKDVSGAVACVNQCVKVAISQGQFDALVDFCFNLGEHALTKSTLLAKLNASDFEGAAKQFELWVNAGGKPQPGLVKRRQAEEAMFRGVAAAAQAVPAPPVAPSAS